MNKICIYTCIIGEYDYLITPKYTRDDIDYVCYTDQNIKSEIWEIRSIPDDICNLDKKIQNKWIKMHPHIILSNYDITIFVDANIFIKDDICSLIDYNKDITLVNSTRANLKNEISGATSLCDIFVSEKRKFFCFSVADCPFSVYILKCMKLNGITKNNNWWWRTSESEFAC